MSKRPYLLYLSSEDVLNKWRVESKKKGTTLPCFIEQTVEEALGYETEESKALKRTVEKARKKIEMLKEAIVKDRLERSNKGVNYSSIIEKSMDNEIQGKSKFRNDLKEMERDIMERKVLDDEWKSMNQNEIKRAMEIMDEDNVSMPVAIRTVKDCNCSHAFDMIFSR